MFESLFSKLLFAISIGMLVHFAAFLFFKKMLIKQSTQLLTDFLAISLENLLGNSEHEDLESRSISPMGPLAIKIKQEFQADIDAFLTERLAASLPALAMFMDDLLIEELKAVFDKELDERLPLLLDRVSKSGIKNPENKQLIEGLVTPIKKVLSDKMWKLMPYLLLIGALTASIGVLVGSCT